MPNPQPSLADRARQLNLIHISFVAAIFVYVLVIVFQTREPGIPADVSVIRPILILAAVLAAGASIWWRRRATGETQFKPLERSSAADSFERLQTDCIITWALSESVAIMGLVLALLSHDYGTFMPFAAAALALLAVHRPGVWPQMPAE